MICLVGKRYSFGCGRGAGNGSGTDIRGGGRGIGTGYGTGVQGFGYGIMCIKQKLVRPRNVILAIG